MAKLDYIIANEAVWVSQQCAESRRHNYEREDMTDLFPTITAHPCYQKEN